MTLGEIYSRVMWMLYGDANYPQSTQTHMRSTSQGIILDAHKAVQMDYDYWFMESYTTYKRGEGQLMFDLPSDFKSVKAVRVFRVAEQLISANISVNTDGSIVGFENLLPTYGHNLSAVLLNNTWYVLTSINGNIAYTRRRNIDSGTGVLYKIAIKEIPIRRQIAINYGQDILQSSCYSAENDKLYIYSQTSGEELVELYYYKYYTFTGTPDDFGSYTDLVTEHAYNAIIYLAVEMEERRRREFDAANYYRALATDALKQLKREHIQRRNTNTIQYFGGL